MHSRVSVHLGTGFARQVFIWIAAAQTSRRFPAGCIWLRLLTQSCLQRTGDRHGGVTKVMYDPSYSEKGVLMAAARTPRAPNDLDFEASQPMHLSDGCQLKYCAAIAELYNAAHWM